MKSKNIKTYPEKIYLQSEEDGPYPLSGNLDAVVTWCEDEQYKSDIEYIRADLADHSAIDALVAAVREYLTKETLSNKSIMFKALADYQAKQEEK